jgi:hypothetical protein
MALELKFEVQVNDCSTIKIKEVTLPYSVGNPTGWGGSNPDISDIVEATIEVTSPTGEVYSYDVLTELPNPVLGEFYFSDISDIPLIDGKYTISYKVVTSASEEILKEFSFINLCNIRCCLDTKWANYIMKCDSCTEPDTKLLEAESLYLGITRGLTACSSNPDIDKYIKILQKLCNSSCKTC